MSRIAAAQDLFHRLADAVSAAWRQDRVFRGAVIGMGVTLIVLLVRPGVSHQDRAPPLPDTSSAGTPVLLNPVERSAPLPPQGSAAPVPKIAPGHSLGDVTVAPAPDSDHFGTVTPGHQP